MNNNIFQKYQNLFLIFLIIIFFFFFSRLFFLQVIESSRFQTISKLRILKNIKSENLKLQRGDIFFQSNNQFVSAALQLNGYQIKIKLTEQVIDNQFLTNLKLILGDSYSLKIEKTIKKYKIGSFNVILDKINREKYIQILLNIEKYNLKDFFRDNFIFERYYWRQYSNIAPKTIGFVNQENIGQYGVEKYYNNYLTKNNLPLSFIASNLDHINFLIKEEGGNIEDDFDVYTTIDVNLQIISEKILEKNVKKWNAKGGGILIINPQNGQIKSMASYPKFNANNFSNEDLSLFTNPFVENLFELGSILKPLIIAIALDSKKIKNNFQYEDLGSIKVEKHIIKNFDNKGRGSNTTLYDILSQSLNTGTTMISLLAGKEVYLDYFEKLGFNKKTNIDLPGEVKNNFRNFISSNREIELATASFGQGIALTPISFIAAISTLINDGYLIKPHVVEYLENSQGQKNYINSDSDIKKEKVFSNETIAFVRNILVRSIDKNLVYKNKENIIQYYSIGAKTGTAQIFDTERRGYLEDEFLHTFFGFFPSSNPEYLVFLYLEKPQNVKYSSQTLAPPFFELVDYLIGYYNVKPDRQ